MKASMGAALALTALLASASTLTCTAALDEEEREAAVDAVWDAPPVFPTRTPSPAAATGVATGDDSASARRRVSQPAPASADRVGRFVVVQGDARAEERTRSLDDRAQRRAFEGAPPVVPHDMSWGAGSPDGCLGCHEKGMTVGERVARPMSHAPMSSCVQCHVGRNDPYLPASRPPAANTFVGAGPPGPGPRAGVGAPPRIPHPTLMRTRCLSCHGEHGYVGLRTEHPTRASCTQCHVGRAREDQLSGTFR